MKSKLTPEDIDNMIESHEFLRIEGDTLTVCVLQLDNGCTVIGTSNVIDPSNYDEKLGETAAYNNAKAKIWELEGYALKRDRIELVVRAVAAVHEANRAYCASLEDLSQPAWEEAPDWQMESAIKGVAAIMDDPDMTPEMSHESWLKEKVATGWAYGPVKDPEIKEHPCMVPYTELPENQKMKDALFTSIVKAIVL